MSKYVRRAGFVAALLVTFVAGGFVLPTLAGQAGPRLFNQVFTLVSNHFVDELDTTTLYEKAARGLVDELKDPYAALYDPDQLKQFAVEAEGHYGGVGMLVEDQDGVVVVSRIFPHTPAEHAGVQKGDRIVGLDGKSVKGWSLTKVTNGLKGPVGTKVEATFDRPGSTDPIEVNFTRAEIHIPAVPYTAMLGDDIGYIPLQQFNETAGSETETAVRTLMAHGARGLVLDLRGNGGGIVTEAVKVANLFLPEGAEVATQRERNTPVRTYVARRAPIAPDLPLVVLIDGNSASATEILTGALQDHDRAVVVGMRSFGKGLVQSVYRLDGGYALKLTTGKWYTPSGRSIHRERKLVDGRLVAVESIDSLVADTASRPVYHSDDGRTLYGGGGIVPDLTVKPDTLSTAEQALFKAILPKSHQVYLTLYHFAWSKKGKVQPDFQVTPAWRDTFYDELEADSVDIDRATYDAGASYIDRMIEDRIARLAFGDVVALRREADDDAQLERALQLFQPGITQKALFADAAAEAQHAKRSTSS